MSSTNEEWFIVKNLEEFINHTRILTYNSYGKTKDEDSSDIDKLMNISLEDQKELDKILSYDESLSIVTAIIKKQKNRTTNKIRYILNNVLYLEIIHGLADRMTSNILHGLVNKGLVEMGFDDESNDFIFWINDKPQ